MGIFKRLFVDKKAEQDKYWKDFMNINDKITRNRIMNKAMDEIKNNDFIRSAQKGIHDKIEEIMGKYESLAKSLL